MELLFVVDTTRFLVAAPPFLNKQPVASQPASQPVTFVVQNLWAYLALVAIVAANECTGHILANDVLHRIDSESVSINLVSGGLLCRAPLLRMYHDHDWHLKRIARLTPHYVTCNTPNAFVMVAWPALACAQPPRVIWVVRFLHNAQMHMLLLQNCIEFVPLRLQCWQGGRRGFSCLSSCFSLHG